MKFISGFANIRVDCSTWNIIRRNEERLLLFSRSEPEFADLFYAYGILDSGRFIGESSYLVGLGSNQASFYLRA